MTKAPAGKRPIQPVVGGNIMRQGFTVVRNSMLIALVFLMASGSAFAQATRTWVSGVGNDANPCSRTAPCKTFAGAISKTAALGIINCLDPGGYGAVTITKSITIECKPFEGSDLASATTGILVNGSGIIVVLRGIDIDGSGTTPGVNGIRFLQGASLTVEDCIIRDFNAAAPNGNGILVDNSSLTTKLHVINTQITGNGFGDGLTGGTGILVKPTGSGSADVTLTNTNLTANVTGLRADSTSTTGNIDVVATETTAVNNLANGFSAVGPTTASRVMLIRSTVASNSDTGVRASGAQALVRLGSSLVTGNNFGVNALSGALIQSYGNNQINANGSDGVPSSVLLK
jgi:hypothetical protein